MPFPTDPTEGQEYDDGQQVWRRKNGSWRKIGLSPAPAYDANSDGVPDELATALDGRYAPLTGWKHPQSNAFLKQLALGVHPASIVVMGDSTGNGDNEWPYLLAESLGADYPAYTVAKRLYDPTADGWGQQAIISEGAAGEAYFAAGTTESRRLTSTDSATLSLTGDLSVRVRLSLSDWTPAAEIEMFNKFGAGGNRSWRFILGTDGRVSFKHTSDGTTEKSADSSVAVPFASDEIGWIRADLDVDNGGSGWTVKFYTSTNDGVTWTQLGTDRTTATVTSVFDSTADLGICNRGGVNNGGNFYAAELWNGIGSAGKLAAAWVAGEMRAEPDGSNLLRAHDVVGNLWSGNSLAVTQGITGAPQLTLANASISGEDVDYFEGAARLSQVLGTRTSLALVSLGHNGIPRASAADYAARLKDLADDVIAAWPNAGVVFTSQNKKKTPTSAAGITQQAICTNYTIQAAAAGRHGYVAAYEVLGDTYTDTDGTHPTSAGSILWASTVYDFLKSA